MQILLTASQTENYIMWLSMILCSIGLVVIYRGRKK